MPTTRPPAVAGSFYPADREQLSREVSRLLVSAPPGPTPKALVAPHAGYVYSGPIAAAAFRRVECAPVRRVVLLGPAHHAWVSGVVLPEADAFATPLGVVPLDPSRPDLPKSAVAHAREHSLEVELPFLQKTLGAFTLVPLAVGDASAEEVAAVLDEVWDGAETLIVVSSDLSHYLPWALARERDAGTARRILALEPVGDDDACGARGVNGLLLAARRKGMRIEQIDLRNSGDTAGDKARVVGYGSFALYAA